ncbi:glycosyltransferase [Clostridium paraputrificum]|uniref:glycosyltransferase n=1 Tax=Clostridium paraputrificum TaxID=29363 RepID=UPI003D33D96F
MNNIIAITVTYNRANTLVRTIKSLKEQSSEKLNKIIIVDNASNKENRAKIDEICNNDEDLEVLYLDENLGGAGGFYHGMKYAREKYDADGYWIMDDDAYPTKDCLEIILDKYKGIKKVGFLCPLIYGIDNEKYQTYHHKDISKLKVKEILNIRDIGSLEDVREIQCNAFVGPLFPKEIVDKIGYPNKDLFIYGDDTEYTYRAFYNGFNGYLIKDAIINHQDPPKVENKLSPSAWWKEYYMFRNKFFFVNEFADNWFYKIIGKAMIIYEVVKKCIAASIKRAYRGYRKLRLGILLKCLRDGLSNNTGKTIDPSEYNKKLQSIVK